MAKLTTTDMGLAIKRQLRNAAVYDDESLQIKETFGVDYVYAADPDNLAVQMDNGQRFRIRIFAESS